MVELTQTHAPMNTMASLRKQAVTLTTNFDPMQWNFAGMRSCASWIGILALAAQAQLVHIPDPVFRAYLQTDHPTVMVGDSLDTTHPDLATITSMFMACETSAGNAEGLQYLYALDSLYTQYVEIWPPFLPADISILSIRNSVLVIEPPWPNELREVYFTWTDVTVPLTLPDSLKRWSASNCRFDHWPLMPPGLASIDISDPLDSVLFETIASIPLPAALASLTLHDWNHVPIDLPQLENTQLHTLMPSVPVTEIPPLPQSLRRLSYVHIVETGCLPELPDQLEFLNFWNASNIDCLPNMPSAIISCGLCPNTLCTIWNNPCGIGNRFKGQVFNDLNGDGIRDVGELGLPGAQVILEPMSMPGFSTLTGHYEAVVGAGAFSAQVVPGPYQQATSAPQTAVFNTGSGGVDNANNLGVLLEPDVQDLSIELTSTMARTGLDNVIWISCRNVGTIPQAGAVRLLLDADQSFIFSDPEPTFMNGDTIAWNLSELPVGVEDLIMVEVNTDTDALAGTALQHEALVDPVAGDQDPDNNMFTLLDTVVVAYDPNDKRVSPVFVTTEELATGERVVYTIRFQNTGNAPAANILITDGLSPALLTNTFRYLGGSHPCSIHLSADSLHFLFSGIELPDSAADEPHSHGFVKFSFIPDPALPPGAVVSNVANIFFDFNEPVHTEPAIFSIESQTNVPTRAAARGSLGVYPNPTKGEAYVTYQLPEGAEQGLLEVRDATGRMVRAKNLAGNGGIEELPKSQLPPGMYSVLLRADGILVSTVKFISLR